MTAETEDPKARPFTVVDRRFSSGGRDAEDEDRPAKPTFVAELEEKLAAAESRAAAILAQYKEAKDEFENARARLSREVGQEVERGRRAFLAELLEVVDSLDRAVEAGATASDAEALRHGIGLVRDQMLAKLGQLGVRRGASLGEPFDPARHDAVATVPVTDAAHDNRIVGVVQEAFFLGDDLLRPARVAVARLAADQAPAPSDDVAPGASSPTATPEDPAAA